MAVLFGSRARGDAHENSDYDIAIDLAKQSTLLDLGEVMATITGITGKKADLVDLAGLSSRDPLLAYKIARDGIPLVERTRDLFLAFKNDACTRYFDIQGFLATQKALLSQRIESGTFGKARYA